jgi:hypothetical protein
MTARDGFELFVASWLDQAGPMDADPVIVDRALATAARTGQRRGLRAALAGAGPWPRTGPSFSSLPVLVRVVVLVALAAAAIAGAVIVGSQRLEKRPPQGPIGTVTGVGSPSVGRSGPVLIRLADGRVAVGGGVEIAEAPLEIFDPTTGTFSSRPALDLPGGGSGFLLSNGYVLFVMFDGNNVRAYAEVVDPRSGSLVALPSTATLHLNGPAAAQLRDGQVLLAGGNATQDQAPPFTVPLSAAEIFDPATNRFARTGAMHSTRFGHSAATLHDGRVLVAGGDGRSDAEIYDPRTGTFGDPIPMVSVRAETLSVVLPDGTVAVFRGGLTALNPERPATGTPVDLFDPGVNAFRPAPRAPFEPLTATALSDGRVFLTTESGTFVYDPATGSSWSTNVRAGATGAVALSDGSVLVIEGGGSDELGNPLPTTAEVFRP